MGENDERYDPRTGPEAIRAPGEADPRAWRAVVEGGRRGAEEVDGGPDEGDEEGGVELVWWWGEGVKWLLGGRMLDKDRKIMRGKTVGVLKGRKEKWRGRKRKRRRGWEGAGGGG